MVFPARQLLLPYFYTHLLARLSSDHWLFFVLQGEFQYLGYLVALAYQPCPIQEVSWGILSGLDGTFCLWRFGRGFRGCRQFFLIVAALAGSFVLSDLHRGHFSCLRVVERLTAHLSAPLWLLIVPQFPVMTGDLKFLASTYLQRPGNFSPCLLVSLSCDR